MPSVDHRLARALGVRTGEGRLAAHVAVVFAVIDAGRGFGEVGVDTLILGRFGSDVLPEWSRATAVMSAGRPDDALPIFEPAAHRFAELGDVWYHAMATGSVAWARFAMGDMVGASHKFVESLIEYHALRDIATTAISLQIGAIVALEAGRPEDAAVLFGAMESLSERYGVKPPAGLAWLIRTQAPDERVAALLDADLLASALERGRRLSLDEAIELVLRIETELPAVEA